MPSMSEDALFKALLKNKPPQTAPVAQKPQVPVRKEPIKPVPPPIETKRESPVIETKITQDEPPVQTDIVVEEIKNLTASVNMMYGLMKTFIVPVLVLILIVGIAILVKDKL